MKNLKIGIVAGVLDIVGLIIYLLTLVIIFIEVSATGTMYSPVIILGFGIVCLGVHIYGLIKSKQEGISMAGHIVGIIGHGLYVFMLGYVLFQIFI